MPRHTPGPWTCDDGRFIIANDPAEQWVDVYIAEIAIYDEEDRLPPHDQIEYNAHLIAAAPDLLRALRNIMGFYHVPDNGIIIDEKELAAYEYAQDAISRAEGRANA